MQEDKTRDGKWFNKIMERLVWHRQKWDDYKGLDDEKWEFELNTIRRSSQIERAEGTPKCSRIVLNNEVVYLFVALADMGYNSLKSVVAAVGDPLAFLPQFSLFSIS